MTVIGFNPKKKKGYFGDNEFAPTKIHSSQNRENNLFELEKVPYFQMNFRVRTGYSIASGYESILDDIDTGMSYSLANAGIIHLFEKIQNGEVEINPETKSMRTIFTVQKKNRFLFLEVPSEEELEKMIQE